MVLSSDLSSKRAAHGWLDRAVRWVAVGLLTAVVLSSCGGDSGDDEIAALEERIEELEALLAEREGDVGEQESSEPDDQTENVSASDSEESELLGDDELIPAGQANRDAGPRIEEGVDYELASDVTITLSNTQILDGFEGQSWTPSHSVDVRIENRSGSTIEPPLYEVHCTVAPDEALYNEGGMMASSSYDSRAKIPDGSFLEGTMLLHLPTDDNGAYAPGCVEPFIEWFEAVPEGGFPSLDNRAVFMLPEIG